MQSNLLDGGEDQPFKLGVMSAIDIQRGAQSINEKIGEKLQSQRLVPIFECAKFDVDSFFNRIPHAEVFKSLEWLTSLWRREMPRRGVIAVPKSKGPAEKFNVAVRSRELAFRIKKELKEKRNFEIRAQPSRVVGRHHYCVRVRDLHVLVSFDVQHCGFCRFGMTMLRSGTVGIAQGSPVSPALASLTMSYCEVMNMRRFMFAESDRWIKCIARWVDDIYCCVIMFVNANLHESTLRIASTEARTAAKQTIERIKQVYEQTSLGINTEPPEVFAGVKIIWCERTLRLYTGQHFPEQPLQVRKYRSCHSFQPMSSKIGFLTGMVLGVLDRVISVDDIWCEESFKLLLLLLLNLWVADYSPSLIESALWRLQRQNPGLKGAFDKLVREPLWNQPCRRPN